MTTINRRAFVRGGSLALVAMGLAPEFLQRTLLAETPKRAGQKTLICIFQRGAVDGLNMVVPFGDKEYYARRRAIAIPATGNNAALDLDGYFGLHPALSPLQPLFKRGEMAVVHAVGSPNPTRSHFDAQDFMETGTPGLKSTKDGWLNRVLQNTDCAACSTTGRSLADGAAHSADHTVGQAGMATAFNPALRAIAMGAAMPTALRGREPALAISDLARFGVGTTRDGDAQSAFERVYGTAAPDIVTGAADEAFEAVRILKAINPSQYRPAAGITYPAGDFGRSLQQIAQLIKAGVPVEIAFADIGGWDTHQNQGAATGQLATRFTEFSRGIRALYDDLGDKMDDVVILTMSEFGRTVAENGTGGTDHGHANCMLVMGGAVAGGKVRGEWPGLAREQLYQGRDLNITTDFRDVFAEVVSKHLKTKNMDKVFPDHQVKAANFRGVITG